MDLFPKSLSYMYIDLHLLYILSWMYISFMIVEVLRWEINMKNGLGTLESSEDTGSNKRYGGTNH